MRIGDCTKGLFTSSLRPRPFVCLRDQKDRFLSYPFGVGLTDGGATPPVGKGKDRRQDQDRRELEVSKQAGREANSRLPSEEEKEEEED